MATDTDKMEAVMDDAYILITDKKISNIQEILSSLPTMQSAWVCRCTSLSARRTATTC